MECDKGEDRISELPDDILMKFVSRMGMKEAAKTSILSKRWRYLWAKGTHLDFNHFIVLPVLKPLCFRFPVTRNQDIDRYINWVNQVVDLHCNPCINIFRICFGFESSDAHHIDKWVRFAISKKVKNLELDFMLSGNYTLTFDIVKPSLDVNDSGIRFLQSLYLKQINVSGDVLEYLLAQCGFLERLHVECSETLSRIKVIGLCRKLKHLTILRCWKLEEVEIEAVNLLYLHYGSNYHWSNIVFKNIPNRVEARFDAACVSDFASIFQQNSHLTQISKLSLAMQFGNWDNGLLEEAYQLKESDSSSDDVGTEMIQDWEYFENMYEMELERTGHPNLKEFQIARFCGWNLDVDLILFLVLISCNLETIICDCSYRNTVVQEVSKSRAAKLAKLIPSKISLSIM